MQHTVSDVTLFECPVFQNALTVMESEKLPLAVKRIFLVKGGLNEVRGRHAHRDVTQYLVCAHGACEVVCDDSVNQKTFLLNQFSQGLFIPPGIWATQTYLENQTTLMVACDAEYDESDYIRDYQRFLAYRSQD